MADYRKRLVDMTDEERAEVAPGAPSFDERYENVDDPLSVQMMSAGLDFTPVGTVKGISDIKDELSSDDPNYLKAIGMGAVEAAALIPGAAPVLKGMLRKGDALTAASKQADVDQAAAILDSSDELKRWQEANKIPENKRQANTEKAQAAAEDLYQGDITSKEARQIIKEDLPITSLYTAESMPNMPTVTEVAGSLGKKVQKTGVVGVKGFDIPAGTRVGSRLDIPAYNNYDTWVVSIHDGKNDTKGSVLGYGQAVRLKNIKFGSESKEALNIARGKRTTTKGEEKPMGKATIARVYGDYVPEDPYALQEQARKLLSDPEWTQVGMNPYRQSNFYDKNTGLPVFEADEVIQVGPLVLAKGVKKPTKTQLKDLAVRTKDGKLRLFNEGGAVMDEQMEMAFGDAGERVDPVSGNEVPTGSLPEEVRDDIPAQLSEGEYVVPADVVRYYGVKFFEDLRTEAKTGFADMEANGRIGGEPIDGMEVIEPEDDLPFDISELQVEDDEQPVMMNEGGVVSTPFSSASSTRGFEIKEYVNDAGEVLYVQFMNGEPMTFIPEGYKVKATAAEEVSEGTSAPADTLYAPETSVSTSEKDSRAAARSRAAMDPAFTQGKSGTDWTSATADEFASTTKNLGFGGKLASSAIGALNVPLGIASGIASGSSSRNKAYDMLDGIAYQLESGSLSDSQKTSLLTQQADLQKFLDPTSKKPGPMTNLLKATGVFGGNSTMYENLSDNTGDGRVSFADTWLGDFLGGDGKFGIQATDEDGNRLTLGSDRYRGADVYEGKASSAQKRVAARKESPYEKSIAAARAAESSGNKEEAKKQYGSAASIASKALTDAYNMVQNTSTDDPNWGAAIKAQSDASRAFTAAKQKETGRYGFFGLSKNDDD